MLENLQCNYEQLEDIATRCIYQSEALDDMRRNIQMHVQAAEGEWIGLGHTAFFDKMHDSVLPASKKLQEALLDVATVIRQINQNLGDAEHESASSFQVIA